MADAALPRPPRPAGRGTHTAASARERARVAPRHATGPAPRFGRLLGWTVAGAALPGLALRKAGHRRGGAALMALVVLAVMLAGGLLLAVGPIEAGRWLFTRPDALLGVAVAALAVAAAWAAVVVAGHALLRRGRLSGAQQAVAAAVVGALVVLVAAPGVVTARYALTQRSLLLTVFDDDESGERDRERDLEGLAGPDTEAEDPWQDTPRVNVLLLGSDAGADRIGTRPDTIILVSIDTASGDAVLFSLPRNLENVPFRPGSLAAQAWPDGFDCPGHACILNAVWSWAEENPDMFPASENPGLTATRQVVAEVLGLQADYYALVNLDGFQEVVDALGGVVVNVERRLPIGGGLNQATGRQYPITGYVEPGRRRLDGYEALWYARSRADSDDYERMRRQRCVIAAVVDQADPARLALAFPDLAQSAERNVETDITASELDAFVELGLRVKNGELRSLPFTGDVIDTADPDYAEIRRLVREAITPPPSPAPSVVAQPSETPSEAPTVTPPDDIPDAEQDVSDPRAAVDVDEACG
jgi:polyisoprenyl-teichoic acid--peptidoglycan teichoic acid transferase